MTDKRIDEILLDIELVKNAYTKAEKLPIVDKYNLSTYKISDIEKELYKLANSYRKEHSEFTKQDFIIFQRLWNIPYSLQKIRQACENESIKWIDFCIEMTQNNNKYSKDRRNEYYRKVKTEREQSLDFRLNDIYNRIIVLTADFRKLLYEHYINTERIRFDYYSSFKELNEELKKDRKFVVNWVKIKSLSENFNWDIFKKKLTNNFESMFNGNIMNISKRINLNKKINISNLILRSINQDPKFFEIIFIDNVSGFMIHCRSIIAAEYSSIVTPHYRFIITTKKI